MGLDVGERRIGVAMSDPTGIIASPLEVIHRNDDEGAVAAILKLVAEYQPGRIVVGMPYSLSGALGPAAERVQVFIDVLSTRVGVEVTTWDERLSTVAADRSMRDIGVKKNRQKDLRDAVAAAFILQGYLDRQQATRR